jgi:DNA-binding GntR family transcriptional regulator
MAAEEDALRQARALLLQPILRHCALHLPAEALAALREDLTALRDRARRGGTADAAAMAAACEIAILELRTATHHLRRSDEG